MARTARLYGIVEELRAVAPRPVTRRRLAARFEVTERTIERDVGYLQQAGLAIWSERGRNGGYAIRPEATMPPLNMSPSEALSIVAALAAMPAMPFKGGSRLAQLKLLAAMPQQDAEAVRDLAGRVRVAVRYQRCDPRVVAEVERAVVEGWFVTIGVAERAEPLVWHEVEAQGFFISEAASWLLAWNAELDRPVGFRLDDIVEVEIHERQAPRRDLDPMLAWIDAHRPPDVLLDERLSCRDVEEETVGADDQMATSVDVRRIALTLPEVNEDPHFGRPSFRVRGKVMLVLKPDERMFIRASSTEQEALSSMRPDVFTVGDGLQVRIGGISVSEARELVYEAWRLVAPKRLVAQFESAGTAESPRRGQ